VLPNSDPHQLNLPSDDWQRIQASVPIACTDIVITREIFGSVTEVALIQRRYRDGSTRWCHLGGRVGIDETLREAALRHINSTFSIPGKDSDVLGSAFPKDPVTHFEFFRKKGLGSSGSGLDPDKHAISWCYRFEWPLETEPQPVSGGEALSVKWFRVSQLPDDLWPGTARLVEQTTASKYLGEKYAAISSQADTHNTLMWQTPVLAMTAQAFLLTIGLGAGISPIARLAAAGLSLVVSILSIQLMVKHSAMQLRDNCALEDIERRRGMDVYHVKPIFNGKGVKAWLTRQESRTWWLAGMAAFGFVSLMIAGVSIARIASQLGCLPR